MKISVANRERMQIFNLYIGYLFSDIVEKPMLGSQPFSLEYNNKKINGCQHIMYKVTYKELSN